MGSTGSSPSRIPAAAKISGGQRMATVPRTRISQGARKLVRTPCVSLTAKKNKAPRRFAPERSSHHRRETLQIKLEKLPEVERAFVHLDFECEHKPEHNVLSRLPNTEP
ncbi:hypothetical protein LguiB_032196 [Lonicera macranthoides]